MLVNTRISIAYKNILESYTIDNIDIFNIKENSNDKIYSITLYNKKEIIITNKCPLCGNIHLFKFSINSLLTSSINIGGCDLTGDPIIIIGDVGKVEDIVSKYKEVYRKIPVLLWVKDILLLIFMLLY